MLGYYLLYNWDPCLCGFTVLPISNKEDRNDFVWMCVHLALLVTQFIEYSTL